MKIFTDLYHPCKGWSYSTWALLLIMMILSAAQVALAQLTHDFRLFPNPQRSDSVRKAYFEYESAAGSLIDDAVLVRNEGAETQRLSLFTADTVTASRGGIAVASHSVDAPERAGAWLTLSQDEMSLEPGEDRLVPFTLSLPDDLPPGEYAASIVAQRAEERNKGQSGPMGVRFIPRFAVTVMVTVPNSGPDVLEPHLEIVDLRAATKSQRQEIIGDLSNTGNIGLDGAEGHLTIQQTDGALAQKIPVRLGYFLAQNNLAYRIGLDPALAAGEYDVTLSLTHSLGTTELRKRLRLGEVLDIPVVRSDGTTDTPPEPAELPRWVWLMIGAAGIGITLLLLLLVAQSRTLARARQTT